MFRVENGRAALQPVEIGESNGIETQITHGVSEADSLILYPTDDIHDGVRIREL